MSRIYEMEAYDTDSFPSSYWSQTIERPKKSNSLSNNLKTDILVIGGGYTGLNAALEIKEKFKQDVSIVDAAPIGWGASGRNGGFACMGGTKKSFKSLLDKYGKSKTVEVLNAQLAAVKQVRKNLDNYKIDADIVDGGELLFAHSQKSVQAIENDQKFMKNEFDFNTKFLDVHELQSFGISSPEAFAGVLNPNSFGLNPLKYVIGLYKAALKENIGLYYKTAVKKIQNLNGNFSVITDNGTIIAKKLIIATNGYSSDDIPQELRGGYLPALSSIMVTRPLTKEELDKQGWTSYITSYNTRNLLHYVRLLPDNRFLFGARGGINADKKSQIKNQQLSRTEFERMYPAWSHVQTEFYWNGLICLTKDLLPFIGSVDDNIFCSFGYHGNGVTTASLAGRQIANIALGEKPENLPKIYQRSLQRFPFASLRRLGLRAAYVGAKTQDWLS